MLGSAEYSYGVYKDPRSYKKRRREREEEGRGTRREEKEGGREEEAVSLSAATTLRPSSALQLNLLAEKVGGRIAIY